MCIRDRYGDWLIPRVRQRPVLLIGAPGIGKTQIMEQAARECGVAPVSYTHLLMVDFSCALKLAMPLSVLSAIRQASTHKITAVSYTHLDVYKRQV